MSNEDFSSRNPIFTDFLAVGHRDNQKFRMWSRIQDGKVSGLLFPTGFSTGTATGFGELTWPHGWLTRLWQEPRSLGFLVLVALIKRLNEAN